MRKLGTAGRQMADTGYKYHLFIYYSLVIGIIVPVIVGILRSSKHEVSHTEFKKYLNFV